MSNTNTMSNDVLNYLVDYYETFNSLPTSVIECTKTAVAYTCFGSNLKNKVTKAGGIRELLSTFEGRGVRAKLKKEKTVEVHPTPVITIDGEQVQATITKRVRPSRSKAAIAARQAAQEPIEATIENAAHAA